MWFCINGKKATDAACQNCPKFFIDDLDYEYDEYDFGHKKTLCLPMFVPLLEMKKEKPKQKLYQK